MDGMISRQLTVELTPELGFEVVRAVQALDFTNEGNRHEI
jgi:hypothetical protein